MKWVAITCTVFMFLFFWQIYYASSACPSVQTTAKIIQYLTGASLIAPLIYLFKTLSSSPTKKKALVGITVLIGSPLLVSNIAIWISHNWGGMGTGPGG